jgi:phosphoglycolate phosphatase
MLEHHHTIIWDWNGTLLNDAWLCRDVMNESLARRDLPLMDQARYQAVFDFPVIDYYRRLGFDFEKESFEIVGAEFIEIYESRRNECDLQKGAHKLLAELHRTGYRQAVLSAYHHDSLVNILKQFGLYDFFDQIIGLDDIYAGGKIEQGKQLIRALDTHPPDCLLIGDTVHDFEVAVELGVDCRLIAAGNHTREKLSACGVPVYDSIHEIFPDL